jgi:hypothetical protein
VLVALTCNLSYSGDRDQEYHGSMPTWTNTLQDPSRKKPIPKKGLVKRLKVEALSSNPSTAKKKKITLENSFFLGLGLGTLNSRPYTC